MKSMRGILIAVAALLIVEAGLVTAALLSDDFRTASWELAEDVVDVWTGDEDKPGTLEVYWEAAQDTYAAAIRPLWTADYGEPSPRLDFTQCQTCHTDYAERSRTGDLYMNHPAHADEGLRCADCHTDVAHPNPLPPQERICAECHTDVQTGGDCALCHTPGSLPHYAELGASRGTRVDCDTCHIPGSIGGQGSQHLIEDIPFDGNDHDLCLTCHQERSCDGCHSAQHPSDWIDTHPAGVGPRGPISCSGCHTLVFCADACHAGVRPKPLPIGET